MNHSQVGVLFDTAHYYTTTKLEHLTVATVPWMDQTCAAQRYVQ